MREALGEARAEAGRAGAELGEERLRRKAAVAAAPPSPPAAARTALPGRAAASPASFAHAERARAREAELEEQVKFLKGQLREKEERAVELGRLEEEGRRERAEMREDFEDERRVRREEIGRLAALVAELDKSGGEGGAGGERSLVREVEERKKAEEREEEKTRAAADLRRRLSARFRSLWWRLRAGRRATPHH